jgi:hypothetical protein
MGEPIWNKAGFGFKLKTTDMRSKLIKDWS